MSHFFASAQAPTAKGESSGDGRGVCAQEEEHWQRWEEEEEWYCGQGGSSGSGRGVLWSVGVVV